MNAFVWVLLSTAAMGQLSNPASRCYFGIKVLEVDTPVAKRLGVERTAGVLVGVVRAGSPSESAGLRAGDVIVSFGGVDTPRVEVLQELMTEATPRTSYRTELYRGNEQLSLNLSGLDPPPTPREFPKTFDLGLFVAPAGSAAAIRFEIETPIGVVVTEVRSGGPAEEAGLRPGDLILQLGDIPTETIEDYQAAAFLCPLGSQQPVTFVRRQQRMTTSINVRSTARVDPPWSYIHPDGSFQVQLPPQWYVFPVNQPGVPLERQYTRVISPFARYELKFFKVPKPAEDAQQALDTFVQQTLQDGPDRESGRVDLRGALGAWVSMPLDSGERLYRISMISSGKRYIVNASAPALSDPTVLPLPVASIVRAIEFPTRIASDPPRGDDPSDSPGTDRPAGTVDKPTSPDPSPTEVPANWQVVSAGNITFRLPPEWIASAFNSADQGMWYQGKQLYPDGSFSLNRDTSVEEVRRDATLRDRSETRVGGQPATLYLVERADPFQEKGLLVAAVDRTGGTVVFSAFAPTDQFEDTAPILRQILDSVRIGTDSNPAPSSNRPPRGGNRDPAAPQPPANKPGVRP